MCAPLKIPRISRRTTHPANWTIGPRREAYRAELDMYTLDELIDALITIREDQSGSSAVRVWLGEGNTDIVALGHNGDTVDIFLDD